MLRKKERLNVSPPEEENLVPTLVDRSNEETSYEDEITSKELYMEMRKRLSSILAAVILLVIGVVFIVVGSLSIYEGDWWYAIPCYIVTFICGIPGGKNHLSSFTNLLCRFSIY